MDSKKRDICCKDIISSLPESLICQILSFLPTKESALTSLLAKKWRYLFALAPSLDFDDSVIYGERDESDFDDSDDSVIYGERDEIHLVFMDFVDRVLSLRGNSTINKLSLKCSVSPVYVSRWIVNVMEHGVSDLDLCLNVNWMPASVFVSNSLVNLRIESENTTVIDLEDVYLPKLKSLILDSVMLNYSGSSGIVKLIKGCHVLEELVMVNLCWDDYWNRSVSSKTLKRLTVSCEDYDKNPDSVTIDTPNLLYLEYSDDVANKYEKVNLDSLVEASIGLRLIRDHNGDANYEDMVGNATDLLMGIRNVQILYLLADSLEVLTFCCESIPVFNNLIHLTLKTHWTLGWESLPTLLKNCPNLETLVFQGLQHKNTVKCGDVDGCLCKSSGVIPTCLSSSPVKVLEILKFGQISFYSDDIEKQNQVEQVKYFLDTMPKLEQLIVYYNTSIGENLVSQLQRLIPRAASSKCSVQLISSDNLSVPTDHFFSDD